MKRALYIVLMLTGLLTFAPRIFADDAKIIEKDHIDLSREKKAFRNYSGDGSNSVSSFCMEGHAFVMVSGDTSNNSSIIQVYEEKNRKVVPK